MYLKKIVIRNFRVFDETGVEMNFKKGLNAIIGENNGGKSSVIDAIRIAFSTIPYKKDIFFSKADFHVGNNGVCAEWAQFDIYLEDVPSYLLEIWDPKSESRKGGEFHVKFTTHIAPNGMRKVKSKSWGVGSEGNLISADTFEAIEIAFLGALRDSESEMKPSKNSKLAQLLRNIVPDENDREELVSTLYKANSDILSKDQIKKAKSAINENLSKMEQEVLQQQVDIGLVEPRFDSIAGALRAWLKPKWVLISNTDELFEQAKLLAESNADSHFFNTLEDGIYIELSVLESEIKLSIELIQRISAISSHAFELYQNGLGYNNLLFMSAVLGDMSISKPGVYHNLLLIEEPEAHLHPQLQELVHRFLIETADKMENIQIIYTSHSPTLVSKVGIDNVNLLYESNHKKRALNLASVDLEKKDKAYLEKYLDVTKSKMFFAKGILFVEGISEALIIPEMAKLIQRPLDKYAVEVVNIDSVAFKPFVKLFTQKQAMDCFEKIAVITDDDRCTNKEDIETYISKDLDYDDFCDDVLKRIKKGVPSSRYSDIESDCKETNISIFGAMKTLEYALCSCDNNINVMKKILEEEFPQVGIKLGKKIDSLTTIEEKATCVWLFIRSRDKAKGSVAQRLSDELKRQNEMTIKGETIETPFIVPDYIKRAIYNVTKE